MGCNCGKNKRAEPPRTSEPRPPLQGNLRATPTPAGQAAPERKEGQDNG